MTLGLTACPPVPVPTVISSPENNDVRLVRNPANQINQGEFASAVVPPGVKPQQCPFGAVVVTWGQEALDRGQMLQHWAASTDLDCVRQQAAHPTVGSCSAVGGADLRTDHALPITGLGEIWVSKNQAGIFNPVTGHRDCDVMKQSGELWVLDPAKIDMVPKYHVQASGDVQILRLPNGDLIQAGLGEKRTNRYYESQFADGNHDGPSYYQRPRCDRPLFESNAVLIRRSRDCGKTWELISAVDSDEVMLSKGKVAQALDRIEIHYDDNQDRIVLTGVAQWKFGYTAPYAVPIWVSYDRGESWVLEGQLPQSTTDDWNFGNPTVHGSAADGRIYFFSCSKGKPTITWKKDLADDQVIHWSLPSTAPRCGFLGLENTLWTTVPGALSQRLMMLGLAVDHSATLGELYDTVWISYTSINRVWDVTGTVRQDDQQVGHLLQLMVKRTTENSGTIGEIGGPEGVIVTERFDILPQRHGESIVFPTLLAPDKAGGVSWDDKRRGMVLVSWLETEHVPGGQIVFHQRAQAFRDHWQSHRTELTMSGGHPDPWVWDDVQMGCHNPPNKPGTNQPWLDEFFRAKKSCWYGDYQYGSFVRGIGDDELEFLRLWAENEPGLAVGNLVTHANFVEVKGRW